MQASSRTVPGISSIHNPRTCSTSASGINQVQLQRKYAKLAMPRDPSEPPCVVEREARQAVESELGAEIAKLLEDSKHGWLPALHIKNMPADMHQGYSKQRHSKSSNSQLNLWAIGALVGVPVGYTDQKGGAVQHDITPIKGQEQAQTNQGSKSLLLFHTENIAHSVEKRCTHLVFAGVRTDPMGKGATLLILADKLVADSRLQPHLQTLRSEQFQSVIYGFESHDEVSTPIGPHAVLYGPPEVPPEIFLDLEMTAPLTPAAEAALEAMKEVCNDPSMWERVLLQPGDVLVIDNRRCLHGREPFTPTYGPDDRWLMRAHIMQDPWPARAHIIDWNARLLHGLA